MELTEEQELDLIYKQFVHCLYEDPAIDYPCDVTQNPDAYLDNCYDRYIDQAGNIVNYHSRFFSFLLALRGFNGFPKVVSKSVYDNISENKLYHGFKEFEHGAQFLRSRDYHYIYPRLNYMTGKSFCGTFFTDCLSEAKTYTSGWGERRKDNGSRVLEGKIISKNGIKVSTLNAVTKTLKAGVFEWENQELNQKLKRLYDFFNDESGKNLDELLMFKEEMLSSNQALAVYLGFCFMFDDVIKYTILFDRSSFVTTVSEARRFCKKSESFKDEQILADEITIESEK